MSATRRTFLGAASAATTGFLAGNKQSANAQTSEKGNSIRENYCVSAFSPVIPHTIICRISMVQSYNACHEETLFLPV